MRKGEIRHKGKIVEINQEFTTVEIISQSACQECHARGLCGLSEEVVKAIQVPTRGFDTWQVGDEVDVCLRKTMGMKAVWISYVVPLMILMVLVMTMSSLVASEWLVGLIAIAGVAAYYFVIFLLRERLATDYVFYIK